MKTLITAALCLAFVLLPAQPQAQNKPKVALIECSLALIVLGVGTVCVVNMIHVCKKLPPLDTNCVPPPPPPPTTNGICKKAIYPRASTWAGNVGSSHAAYQTAVTLQCSDGKLWESAYTFTLTQPGDGTLTAVAFQAGVPVMTNTAPIIAQDGEPTAWLDFSGLALTNRGTFYRIASP